MKKYALIIVVLLIVVATACRSQRQCKHMKYYNSDRKRGLAH